MQKVSKYDYKKTAVDYKRQRKSQTIPDQSLSIREIVRRFTRGIGIDVVQRDPVYVDQSEHDLEQLSRMDFAEKADMADLLKAQAEAVQQEALSKEREKRETRAKQAAKKAEAQAGLNEAGKVDLDNTLPVDTKQGVK